MSEELSIEEQEKRFLYGRIKFLTEEVGRLNQGQEMLIEVLDGYQKQMDHVLIMLDRMTSPGYIAGQAKMAKDIELAWKVARMREFVKKRGDGDGGNA